MDQRFEQLKSWMATQLAAFEGFQAGGWQLLPVSGDASFRRYFRAVSGDRSWIGVDAPPEKENSHPFIAVAGALEPLGVHVPHIHQYDLEQGFMLLSDLGDDLYLPHLNSATADNLYSMALAEILKMQRCTELPDMDLPKYDLPLLQREMELFRDWFSSQLLKMNLTDEDNQLLDRLFSELEGNALEQVQVFVHRDYHSRNLMYLGDQLPGVIDFQDAVLGPITYDLVSLLRDCYISWPQEQVYAWVESFYGALLDEGHQLPGFERFCRWFDLMGAQRHLKAIGIFARLNLRDGKSGYLSDIPRTMSYLLTVTGKYDNLQESYHWLQQRVIPAMQASGVWSETELKRCLAA